MELYYKNVLILNGVWIYLNRHYAKELVCEIVMPSLSDCDSPLGIQSDDIPNSDMTASSEVSKMEFIFPLGTIAVYYDRLSFSFSLILPLFAFAVGCKPRA